MSINPRPYEQYDAFVKRFEELGCNLDNVDIMSLYCFRISSCYIRFMQDMLKIMPREEILSNPMEFLNRCTTEKFPDVKNNVVTLHTNLFPLLDHLDDASLDELLENGETYLGKYDKKDDKKFYTFTFDCFKKSINTYKDLRKKFCQQQETQ